MRYGGGHPKPTLKRSKRNFGSHLLPKRELSLLTRNSLVPIGAVEMVIADSPKGVIFPMKGHKVVVKGPGISDKEKGKEMAKEKGEEKEKGMERARAEEDEEEHQGTQR